MKFKMKVEFSWYFNEDTSNIEPMLSTNFIGNYNMYLKEKMKYFFIKDFNENDLEYKGLIVDLLTEYAWEKYENIKYEIKEYIEISINEIKEIIFGKKKKFFFNSIESWGAEIKKEGVLIYFVFQDDYFDIMPINCFYEILVNWRKFLESVPDLNNKVVIECTGD